MIGVPLLLNSPKSIDKISNTMLPTPWTMVRGELFCVYIDVVPLVLKSVYLVLLITLGSQGITGFSNGSAVIIGVCIKPFKIKNDR